MYEIEKDVPIPERQLKSSKYGLEKMEPGDSIFIPSETRLSGIHSLADYYALRHPPKKFTTRKVEGGYRIWRIK